MYRTLSIILVIMIIGGCLYSQNTVTLLDETTIDLTKEVEIYTDLSQSLTINDILKSDIQSQFANNKSDVIYLAKGNNTIWIRLCISNISDRQKSYYLEIRDAGIDNIKFFTLQNSILISSQARGIDLIFDKKHPNTRFFTHQIVLDPNEKTTCYVRVQNHGQTKHFSLLLQSEMAFLQHVAKEHILSGIFYGILLTFILSVLALFLIGVKKRTLLLLLIYIFLTSVLIINFDGFGTQFIYPNIIWISNNINIIIPYLIFIVFTQFSVNVFRNICKESKRICASLSILPILGTILLLIQIIFNLRYMYAINITSFFAILSIILLFVALFNSFKTTNKVITKLYLISLIFMVTVFVMFIVSSNSTNYGFFQLEIYIKLCLLLHFTFIIAVIVKLIGIKFFENEKASLKNLKKLSAFKEQATIHLENTVRERTKSLQVTNRQLNSLIKRNNEITAELHKQREEIDKKNFELEKSFKKSSAQHIRIHKAMLDNLDQQNKLSASLETIQEKNNILEQQNEEIRYQQEQIKEQNNLLEEKARNITDSILYAERIQNSFLPPESIIKSIFPDSFVFFKPKDILSGDIYFFDNLLYEGLDLKFATVVDCTGHGIPGALMSILASDAINDALHNYKLTDPGQIISCLNETVINSLNKKNNIDHVKDGMDMSIIVVDYKNRILRYSGAKNPLYFIKNGVLTVQKGYIHSVGTIPVDNEPIVFPTYNFNFEEGDIVYLFSDGYADQFGGLNGSKFKHSRFQNLLLEINKMPMSEQIQKLDNTFSDWKGNNEQVDDVLVIGIRL